MASQRNSCGDKVATSGGGSSSCAVIAKYIEVATVVLTSALHTALAAFTDRTDDGIELGEIEEKQTIAVLRRWAFRNRAVSAAASAARSGGEDGAEGASFWRRTPPPRRRRSRVWKRKGKSKEKTPPAATNGGNGGVVFVPGQQEEEEGGGEEDTRTAGDSADGAGNGNDSKRRTRTPCPRTSFFSGPDDEEGDREFFEAEARAEARARARAEARERAASEARVKAAQATAEATAEASAPADAVPPSRATVASAAAAAAISRARNEAERPEDILTVTIEKASSVVGGGGGGKGREDGDHEGVGKGHCRDYDREEDVGASLTSTVGVSPSTDNGSLELGSPPPGRGASHNGSFGGRYSAAACRRKAWEAPSFLVSNSASCGRALERVWEEGVGDGEEGQPEGSGGRSSALGPRKSSKKWGLVRARIKTAPRRPESHGCPSHAPSGPGVLPAAGRSGGIPEDMPLQQRRAVEAEVVAKLDRVEVDNNAESFWFLIDSGWMSHWADFVVGKMDIPPGPVTNYKVYHRAGDLSPEEADSLVENNASQARRGILASRPDLQVKKDLRAGKDYRAIRPMVWFFYREVYGTDDAPDICRWKPDLYSDDVSAARKLRVALEANTSATLELLAAVARALKSEGEESKKVAIVPAASFRNAVVSEKNRKLSIGGMLKIPRNIGGVLRLGKLKMPTKIASSGRETTAKRNGRQKLLKA